LHLVGFFFMNLVESSCLILRSVYNVKVFVCPMLTDTCNVPRHRPLVLLLRAASRRRRLYSIRRIPVTVV